MEFSTNLSTQLTMDKLKKYLSSKGLDTKGKKADLVEKVERYVTEKVDV